MPGPFSPQARRLLSVVLLAAGCAAPPDDAGSLRDTFRSATEEYALPPGLLESIAWLETRFIMRPGEPTNDNGFGVMHLVDQGPGTPLPRAAELLGVTTAELKTDRATNVRGAAAVLRAIADDYFAKTPALDEREPAHWWQVLMLWSGAHDAEVADLYATGVFRVWNDGVRTVLSDGSLFTMRPRVVDPSGQKLFGEFASALDPEYPAADRYLPALRYTAGRGGESVDYIVIHTAQGSYAGTVGWFQNQQVQASAHYVTGRNGELTQMVKHGDTAWHAGNWDYNQRSIGIEHEGFVDDPGAYTQAMYTKSAALVRFLLDTYGIPRVHTERAWPSGARGVIGHYQVPDPYNTNQYGGAGHHHDPCVTLDGSQCFWNWTTYMALVGGTNGGGTPTTGTLTGTVFSGAGGCQFVTGQGFVNCSEKVGGARVFVPETGTTAVADANGSYRLDVPAGARANSACKTVTPLATATGFLDAQPVLGTRTVCAGETTYGSVILQPAATGTVTGLVYVVNTSNAQDRSSPVEGAQVSSGSTTVNTGADGRFSITLPIGDRPLQASKSGLVAQPVTVTVNEGRTTDLEIGMLPGGEDLQGPVITFTRPADGATVATNPVLVEGHVDEPLTSLQVGGIDAFDSLDSDRNFSVLVPLPDPAGAPFVVEAIGLDASNNIGRASITVTFALTEGMQGKVVNGVTGEPVWGALVQSGSDFVRTGDDGRYALGLPHGPVSVTVQAPRFKPRVVAVEIPAGAVLTHDWTIVPSGDAALLTIDSPKDGAKTSAAGIDVTGTVSLKGVTHLDVNGVDATRTGDGFTAAVPLEPGDNTLVATARTDDGLEVTATIHVTRTKGCGCTSPVGTLGAAPVLLLLRRRRSR